MNTEALLTKNYFLTKDSEGKERVNRSRDIRDRRKKQIGRAEKEPAVKKAGKGNVLLSSLFID